jgi:uncharacterized protein (DUF1684 family)
VNNKPEEDHVAVPNWLDLYGYRREVAAMYRKRAEALRAGEDERLVLQQFRTKKDALFARHPQSPLSAEHRKDFTGLSYFPYDPALRVEGYIEATGTPDEQPDEPGAPRDFPLRPAAKLRFALLNTPLELTVFWINVYGGGLFLPFVDATSGAESYGGGRYLIDTVKGADFYWNVGTAHTRGGGAVVLDFNYAYNPSCVYDARWLCPLAPRENRLALPVRAGERGFSPPV